MIFTHNSVLMTLAIGMFVVNSGCSMAMHGPCKTIGYDCRMTPGGPRCNTCVHDRCLGWMIGRSKGPFHYLRQGTVDPGCGPCNQNSLIGGQQGLLQQFPGRGQFNNGGNANYAPSMASDPYSY